MNPESKTTASPKEPAPVSIKPKRSLRDRLPTLDRRLRIGLLAFAILLALSLGLGAGFAVGRAPVPEVQDRLTGANARSVELREEIAQLEGNVQTSNEQIASLQSELANQEARISNLKERALKTKELRKRKAALDKREKAFDQRASQLDDREARLDARRTNQQEREDRLDKRAASIRNREKAIKDATFRNGIFVVGEDIPAGTYSAGGGTNCRWARLSGLGGTPGEVIARHSGRGPQRVAISASDAAFKTSGCGRWSPS
jgi:hypothetical protein